MIRSGHSSGEEGLCLSANASTFCSNTEHTLLVLPLPLWLPPTPIFLPNCGSHCPCPHSLRQLLCSNSRQSWGIWSTVASSAVCVLSTPSGCHHLPLQTHRPNCLPGLIAYLIDTSKSGSKQTISLCPFCTPYSPISHLIPSSAHLMSAETLSEPF